MASELKSVLLAAISTGDHVKNDIDTQDLMESLCYGIENRLEGVEENAERVFNRIEELARQNIKLNLTRSREDGVFANPTKGFVKVYEEIRDEGRYVLSYNHKNDLSVLECIVLKDEPLPTFK